MLFRVTYELGQVRPTNTLPKPKAAGKGELRSMSTTKNAIPTTQDDTVSGEAMTIKEVAALAGCSDQTVYNALHDGNLAKAGRGQVDVASARFWIAARKNRGTGTIATTARTSASPSSAITLISVATVIGTSEVPRAVLADLDGVAYAAQADAVVSAIGREADGVEAAGGRIGGILFLGVLGGDRGKMGNHGNRGDSIRAVAEQLNRPGWSARTLQHCLRAHIAAVDLGLDPAAADRIGVKTLSWLMGSDADADVLAAVVEAVQTGDDVKIKEVKRLARQPMKSKECAPETHSSPEPTEKGNNLAGPETDGTVHASSAGDEPVSTGGDVCVENVPIVQLKAKRIIETDHDDIAEQRAKSNLKKALEEAFRRHVPVGVVRAMVQGVYKLDLKDSD